jgi:predicted phosphohydrolase
MNLTLILLSDTHDLHTEVQVPPGDILIIAGDWTKFCHSLRAIESFSRWLGELPHRHKLLTFGNHEFWFEADERRRYLLPDATVLLNEGVEIDGLRIWGSPVTPLYGGAFGLSSPKDRVRHWARIPRDTHVLVTHGPPHGILDRPPGQEEHQGDPELLEAIKGLPELRLHVFGHVHGANGMVERNGVTFANVALMGVDGVLEHEPVSLGLWPVWPA